MLQKTKPYQIQSINVNEYLKCFSMRVYELVFFMHSPFNGLIEEICQVR